MSKNIGFIFHFSWFFLMTLNSYYFYNLGFSLFPVISAIFAFFMLLLNKSKPKTNQRSTIILVVLFIISLITSLPNTEFFLIKRIPLFLILLPVALYSTRFINENQIQLFSILKLTIIIHVLFYYFQFVYYYTNGVFIDFIEPITGVSQRTLGGSLTIGPSGIKLMRTAGLYSEPGTYSTYIFILFLLYKQTKKNIYSIDKVELFDIIVLISVLLSFSTYGFIFSSLYVSRYLFKINFSNKVVLLLFIIPIALFVVENYLGDRFQRDLTDSGISFRQEAVILYFKNVVNQPFHLLFGYSLFVDMNDYFKVNLAWNDVGLIFVILLNTGVVGIILLFRIILPKLKDNFLLILIILLSKISITVIFLWFVISFIFGNEVKKKVF